jgi:hypothetical protein
MYMTSKKKDELAMLIRFSDPESLGLFMDALRALQIYEDESAGSQPDSDRLRENLELALALLETGYASFPLRLAASLLPGDNVIRVNQSHQLLVSRVSYWLVVRAES